MTLFWSQKGAIQFTVQSIQEYITTKQLLNKQEHVDWRSSHGVALLIIGRKQLRHSIETHLYIKQKDKVQTLLNKYWFSTYEVCLIYQLQFNGKYLKSTKIPVLQ